MILYQNSIFNQQSINSMGSGLLQILAQGFFILAVTSLFLNWLVSKLSKFFNSRRNANASFASQDNPDIIQQYQSQQALVRQRIQKTHDEKASDYNERILKPREVEKKRKQEEDFQKFLGPAWKGKGTQLGGNESDSSSEDFEHFASAGRKAASRRKVPEDINLRVAAAAEAAASARSKQKKVIQLPKEPDVHEENVITVMLRTPIGTTLQRRFYFSDSIQCLLDFMTTHGFNQRIYTVSTSYPRILIHNVSSCFSDYNFGARVALNIEEKD